MEPQSLEQEIQARGLTAPRVLPEDLEREIIEAQYHVFSGTTTTVCCLTMRNGMTVVGESACADARNFDIKLGREIARKKAVEKMWPLLGFRLRDQLHGSKRAELVVDEIETTLPAAADPSPALNPCKPVELGDQVHYYEQVEGKITEPMIGIVSKVLGHGHLSLVVFAPNGTPHARTNVQLVYPGDAIPSEQFFARPK
jgi:hypothetical protein